LTLKSEYSPQGNVISNSGKQGEEPGKLGQEEGKLKELGLRGESQRI
jgi:hypothetical protein